MAKRAKKRGVKPGTKRGPYKKIKKRKLIVTAINSSSPLKVGDKITISDYAKQYTPTPTLALCGQLEDSILLLENRISNVIAKINSLMG